MTALEERDVIARIDAAHADIALKQEQLRQLQSVDLDAKLLQYRYEPRRFWLAVTGVMTGLLIAFAAAAGAGAALVSFLIHR